LGRKTLGKPNHDEGIVSTKPRPKNYYFLGLVIVSLFVYLSCSLALHRPIFHTSVVLYSLFVLKVPLNTNKPNQKTNLMTKYMHKIGIKTAR